MRTARIVYHHEPEGWWADSPDLLGWSAAAESREDLEKLVRDGAEFFAEEPLDLFHLNAPVPGTATVGAIGTFRVTRQLRPVAADYRNPAAL
jgi:predicted RNase H-like HicB family nuclease